MKPSPAKSCPSCSEQYDADVLFCPRDGTPLASLRTPSLTAADKDPYVGIELGGQIRVKHLIGIGSMGRVYRAFQGGIERDVAVKILHRELSGNAELVSRFHREAKVASRLVHPNVVQVLMTGTLPPSPDPGLGGELYLVMEHLDGISLLSALAAAGTDEGSAALPLPRALHIALQVCDAVGEAHLQGIVHRDLKPENVMLVRRGEDHDYVKVLDFGIARLDWADRDMATQAGLIFGTAKYISPEGAEGQPVTPAADVYSIATMLYQMLAGRTPFEGDSPVALLVQHTHAPPAELRSIARASYVPAPLSAVIMQNLAKKPAERAQNARLLARDLVTAARASGLYPEELSQSTLFSPANLGVVKLASKERTKQHELSAELAAKIGGIAAAPSTPRRDEGAATPLPATPAPTLPSREIKADPPLDPTLRGAPPSAMPEASVPSTAPPGAPDLDFDGGAAGHGKASGGSTMQGTETSLSPDGSPARPRRARVTRLAAILACTLVAAPLLVIGGLRLGGHGQEQADSLDAAIDEANEQMRRHAWDAPPGKNFKETTDRALLRFPNNPRLRELRHDAAGRVLTDALGRKYAGDAPEALRLAHLALDLDPELTTAQHLAAELDGPRAPEIAPAASGSAAPLDRRPPPQKKGGRDLKPDGRTAAPSATPSANASALPGALLPTPAPPPPPSAPPAATGPWL
ncbi:MAG: serine/threonine-protein kinase [Byssovorax sp.]